MIPIFHFVKQCFHSCFVEEFYQLSISGLRLFSIQRGKLTIFFLNIASYLVASLWTLMAVSCQLVGRLVKKGGKSCTYMILSEQLFNFIWIWFQTNLKFLILLQPERLNVRRLSQLWSKELSSTNERLIKPRLSSVKLSPLHLKH